MPNDAFIKFKEEMARRGLRVSEKIGEGGMGAVYEAFDDALERRAAVKIMRADAGNDAWRERFRREAKFAAKITHPGVAQVYQAGELEGLLYYVMEFVDGQPLSAFLKKARFIAAHAADAPALLDAGYLKRPDPNMPYFLRELIAPPLDDPSYLAGVDELIASIADILAAVHSLDSVHRDIKPSNIMITSDGRVKLVDFGLVKQSIDRDITLAGQFVGTFDYMAPEQFRGRNSQISPASDIYSLGVVYYELAGLVKPFEGEDPAALIGAITSSAPADPRGFNEKISDARARVILKCLAKEPSDRFTSAAELASAVRELKSLSGEGIMAGIKNFFFGLFSQQPENRLRPHVSGKREGEPSRGELFSAAGPGAGVSRADLTASPTADERLKISRALFGEAVEEYFREFVTDSVRAKLSQAFDINSHSADILLLYFLFLNHGIITRPEFNEKLKLVRACDGLDDREKLILEAVVAMYVEENMKAASAAGFRYMNLYADDLLMTVFVCLVEMMQGNFTQALQCADGVLARRESFLLMHLVKADIYSTIGDIEKSLEIGEAVASRFPKGANHRFLMLQNLIIYGRLDEAGALIANIEKSGGDESDAINYQRSSYYLQRGMIKESVMETRKLIALEENPLFKSYHYYRLYRIFEIAGETEKASQYLDAANRTSPGHDFKSFARIEAEHEKMQPPAMALENIAPEHFREAFGHAKSICFKTLDPLTLVKLSLLSETSYYHLEPAEGGRALNCERLAIYSDYHFKPSPVTKNMICVESVPISPFITQAGNALDAAIKKCQHNGSYYALLNFSPPQKNGESIFITAQFEPSRFARDEKSGRFDVRMEVKRSSNAAYTGVVVSFPDGYEAVRTSRAPDRSASIAGRTFYFYTVFLFCGQKFFVEVELAPKK